MSAALLRLRARTTLEALRERRALPLAALGVGLAAALAASAAIGGVSLSLSRVVSGLVDARDPLHALLWDVRLPRIAGGALVGASLGVAGVLLQTVVRNPLADAGLLGVTSGAGFGGLLAIVLRPESTLLPSFAAFGGGLVAVIALPLLAARGARAPSALRLVLTGAALQATFFAGIAVLTFLFADRAPSFAAFTVGSLSGTSWGELRIAAPPIALGLAASALLARALDALLLDDAASAGIGLAVLRARLAAASIAALLAAAAVGVAGLVGFVGLVVPNAARLWIGANHRFLLVAAALGGAALTVAADTLARRLAAPLELPVGALLAGLGAPYFLWLLWRKLP
jgi:iron complex transport system permease protein